MSLSAGSRRGANRVRATIENAHVAGRARGGERISYHAKKRSKLFLLLVLQSSTERSIHIYRFEHSLIPKRETRVHGSYDLWVKPHREKCKNTDSK